MKTISLTFPDGTTTIYDAGVKGSQILENFGTQTNKILAIRVNNEILSLDTAIDINCTVSPVELNSKEGAEIYRRSLCFVLAASAQKLFPCTRLLVGHSLGYGYYYTLDSSEKITEDHIKKLEEQIKAYVDQDLPIQTDYISYQEAINLFEKLNLKETRKQMNFICKPRVQINMLDGFSDLYFGPLVEKTGILKHFELKQYDDGFLLRFPKSNDPETLTPFCDNPKIFEIYKNYKTWGRRLNVTSAASLNDLIATKKINDFIDISETYQLKNFADIASQIQKKGNVKVVLIAGPSSSGKTTSAKKLSLQLQAIGYNPKIISLDCYYVGRENNPKDENGNYDYECLEALDIKLLNENLLDLFSGKETAIPEYDFNKGERYYTGKTMHLGPGDILIMEGIHGLNDKLTPLVKSEYKFKIYLSALTQLNLDDHNRISTSDNRLIRRIVRDSKFRGKSAAETIGMWDSVQKGERLHIFPHQNNADAVLNTALDYELSVLKVYAEPLLRSVNPMQYEYAEASRLLRFLDNFTEIPSNYVPVQSIIREFIGGSAFHY